MNLPALTSTLLCTAALTFGFPSLAQDFAEESPQDFSEPSEIIHLPDSFDFQWSHHQTPITQGHLDPQLPQWAYSWNHGVDEFRLSAFISSPPSFHGSKICLQKQSPGPFQRFTWKDEPSSQQQSIAFPSTLIATRCLTQQEQIKLKQGLPVQWDLGDGFLVHWSSKNHPS